LSGRRVSSWIATPLFFGFLQPVVEGVILMNWIRQLTSFCFHHATIMQFMEAIIIETILDGVIALIRDESKTSRRSVRFPRNVDRVYNTKHFEVLPQIIFVRVINPTDKNRPIFNPLRHRIFVVIVRHVDSSR